jgi:hypothetical protein
MADPNGQDPPGTPGIDGVSDTMTPEVTDTSDAGTTARTDEARINGPDPPGTP